MNKKLKKLLALTCCIGMMMTTLTGCTDKKKDNGGASGKESDIVKSIKGMNLPKIKDDYTVNLGYYNCDHMTAACIGKDSGIFEACGIKVNVTGNGKVPQAMSAGKMDAGYIGFQNIAKGFLVGTPITIAANNHTGGSYYLVVSNDITDGKQLVGQTLGIGPEPEKGSSWRVMSKTLDIPTEGKNYNGISFDSDQSKYLALKTGKIKGYTACDPWGSMAEYEKTGKIFAMDDRIKGEQEGECCVLSLNTNFAKAHPDIAKRLILAHSKSIEFIYTHPLEAANIFANNYGVPLEVGLRTVYKKTVGEGRTLTWKLNNEAIQRMMDENISHGDYGKVTVEQIVNHDYINDSKVDDFEKFISEKVDSVFPEGITYEEWLEKAKTREPEIKTVSEKK
ncbi:NitT/TauT family transport system substrate-binding protein [Hathewaya proteolytica DSM 3090]|uniref:NitT/TauT family transport system substrate-binding protein n=1 Tax=Hathewaya proteolytica DSM 3090 TaxID=1121331 RepID=A0A1M6PV28_9CLOT|nr:ABC transporter substrate-binding subunit SaoX [Hathewaya proteolytica]SHK11768.1 NitT/TauT family transport system substrate-binding protein [Hathewaya proteolytica DSM 3090]